MRDTLSQLRLRELLMEVQDRVEQIEKGRDRLDGLVEAMLVVTSGLELDVTLRTIVHTAIELVDARYGALGVRGEGHKLFAVHLRGGIPTEATTWRGDSDRCRRAAEAPGVLSTIPKASGWTTFSSTPHLWGFPLTIRRCERSSVFRSGYDEVFGNCIYKRRTGNPSPRTTRCWWGVAAAAGIAIDNARLYEQSRARQSWIEATRDIGTQLLSGIDPATVFHLMADEALNLTGAEGTLVAVPIRHRGTVGRCRRAGGCGNRREGGRARGDGDSGRGYRYRPRLR